jgi:hypothetical protein
MGKVDIMDIGTPIFGDRMNTLPPYVLSENSGEPMNLTYTEKSRVAFAKRVLYKI